MREGFGSEQRSRYIAQLANSGPIEVAGFAALAVNIGNKVLAAAVMSRLDGMKTRERELSGISRDQLADLLCGEDFKKAREAITIAGNRLQSAVNQNRDFERSKVNTTAKIGEALRLRNETGALDDDDDQDGGEL